MNIYKTIFPLLNLMESEKLQLNILNTLIYLNKKGLLNNINKINNKPINIMGIDFPNMVGLAAGFDKNAIALDALSKLGFGFIEIGTITPKPQKGNIYNRMNISINTKSIINNMGFPNIGVDRVVENIVNSGYKGILGVSIGKNNDTTLAYCINDFLLCMKETYKVSSYQVLNFSCSNISSTKRLLFNSDLIKRLKHEQRSLTYMYNKYVPLLIKVPPNLQDHEILILTKVVKKCDIDGLIVSNTIPDKVIKGSWSGEKVKPYTNKLISLLYKQLGDNIPIIASGGILSSSDAKDKLDLGAKLVQLYTGLIFEGYDLIKECADI